MKAGVLKKNQLNKHVLFWSKQQYVTLTTTRTFDKRNVKTHFNTSHKNSKFRKTGSHFMEKMSCGFPSDVLQLLCLSAAFYFVELSPTFTWCCSFGLPAVYMLLSGALWFQELRQSSHRTPEGKPQDISDILTYIVKFCFSKQRVVTVEHSAGFALM